MHIFECIDAHTCGNPVRVVAKGGPELKGNNMSEKRQHFLKEFDWIRKGLMFEPRGHDMMSGSILYPPHDPQNDVSVLFIETSGCYELIGNIDWYCFSPKKFKKPTEEAYTKANELKVVISHPSDFQWAEEHAAKVNLECKLYLQPEWSKQGVRIVRTALLQALLLPKVLLQGHRNKKNKSIPHHHHLKRH